MRIAVRYDVPRDFGKPEPETRREYNMRFGVEPGPEAEFPDVVSHVWNWFWSISNRRSGSDSGPQPLSFTEISAWAMGMRIYINPEEIDMLTQMDNAFMSANADELRGVRARKESQAPKSKR